MERRPDVAAAERDYQAATADIGVAEALRLPSLSLTGSGGMISSQINDLLQGASGTYTIGPNLAGPLFDAGRGKARVDAARAAAGEALAAHTKASQEAFREGSDSLNAYVKTGEIPTQQASFVNSNQHVADVANQRFFGGASS